MTIAMKNLLAILFLLGIPFSIYSQSVRERILFDDGWLFAFGNATSPAKDFGCGTEYFNYLTKAASIHNEGPYSLKFQPEKWEVKWKQINLPHDWVVDLPYDSLASHSHGYKTVGYKYPEKSVGWYRKTFTVPQEDLGKHLYLEFDGIFRDARIWMNGFYLGHEPSGYATQIYDVTEYLNYGGENLITVRADATFEEGWFYEGGGIYRHVWLNKTAPLHIEPLGVFVSAYLKEPFDCASLMTEVQLKNSGTEKVSCEVWCRLLGANGQVQMENKKEVNELLPQESCSEKVRFKVYNPHLWSVDDPYLYKMETSVWQNGKQIDKVTTPVGIRQIRFDADRGFFLNGKSLKLKGVNMHQDHPGVGVGMPDALQVYRLKQLKKFGCNAYRSSHNPMTPEMLDACDSLGILVIEENRLMGINNEHIELLKRMIKRDRNHPSIILWSVGNEEWGIEWKENGERIVTTMRDYCHRFDPTRPVTVATSGGPQVVIPADVAGYNYILQNPVERSRKEYPQRCAIGSEETSGCGTRGIYFDAQDQGHMVAHNRKLNGPDSLLNCIERGWKFYEERPYLGGLFYWTGFDYRGEPNPMKFPATGSQFGILDYCGFPKDEAYYLKSWWTNEPVLHILPHWNLQGHEGDSIEVWVYSNCEEVALTVNGKKMERKNMPRNGYLSWKTVYQPGTLKAIGYKSGKRVLTEQLETTGVPVLLSIISDRSVIKADNRDVAVVRIELQDKKKRLVPTACEDLILKVSGPIRILGVGNGDPAYRDSERPLEIDARSYRVQAFNGLAQVLLQSNGKVGEATLTVQAKATPLTVYKLLVKE